MIFVLEKEIKQKEKSKTFYSRTLYFSQECNKMFRVGAKIRVGRETGNRYNFDHKDIHAKLDRYFEINSTK